jgi:hypothetical protein
MGRVRIQCTCQRDAAYSMHTKPFLLVRGLPDRSRTALVRVSSMPHVRCSRLTRFLVVQALGAWAWLMLSPARAYESDMGTLSRARITGLGYW